MNTIVTLKLPPLLKHALRVAAAEKGISMSEFVRLRLEESLFFGPSVHDDKQSSAMIASDHQPAA